VGWKWAELAMGWEGYWLFIGFPWLGCHLLGWTDHGLG
jgi:hypothetical protein